MSAENKVTMHTEQITITNDRGRLTKDEIERMIKDAEEFAEVDRQTRLRIDAKNALEGHVFSAKRSIEDEKTAQMLSEEDKEAVGNAVKEVIEWLGNHPAAEVEQYESKQKEFQQKTAPIFSKLYEGGGGSSDSASEAGHDEL